MNVILHFGVFYVNVLQNIEWFVILKLIWLIEIMLLAYMWEIIDTLNWLPNRASLYYFCKSWNASQWFSN